MTRLLTPFTLNTPNRSNNGRRASLDDTLSSMLSEFWDGTSELLPTSAHFNTPKVDVWEEEQAFKVEADLPGINEKDVDVTVHDGMLTIKATTEAEKTESEEGKTYYRRERSFSSFERHISLPDGINEEKVDASLKNGVLCVTLPKSEDAKPKMRKISVKAK